jgi:hypothetical protein
MDCPKKNKHCKVAEIKKKGRFYVCTGVNGRPKKYKYDVIKLCLTGEFVKDFSIEMTAEEALVIARSLLRPLA